MSDNFDPFDLRSIERKKEQSDERTKLALQTEADDYKWLVGSKRGRRIVWRMLEQSGVFRLSFNTNAMQMAFAEGNRNFGNRLMAMVQEIAPETLTLMMKESRAEDEKVR